MLPTSKPSPLAMIIGIVMATPSLASAMTIDMTTEAPLGVIRASGDIHVIGQAKSDGNHPYGLISIDYSQAGQIINDADLSVDGTQTEGLGNGTFYVNRTHVSGDLINRGQLHTSSIWDWGVGISDSTIEGRIINEGDISFQQNHPHSDSWIKDPINSALALDTVRLEKGFENRGSIWSRADNAVGVSIELSDIDRFDNYGSIRADGKNSTAITIDPESHTTLNNSGDIIAQGENSTAVRVESATGILNHGLIQSDGIAVKLLNRSASIQMHGGLIEGGQAAISGNEDLASLAMWDGTVRGDVLKINILNVYDHGTIDADLIEARSTQVDGHLTLLKPHTRIEGDLVLNRNAILELPISHATEAHRPILSASYIGAMEGVKIQVTPKPNDFATQGAQAYRLIESPDWYKLDLNNLDEQRLSENDLSVNSTSELLRINSHYFEGNTLMASLQTLTGEEAAEIIEEVGGDQNAQDALGELTEIIPQLPQDDALFNEIAHGDAQRLRELADQLSPDVNGGAIQTAIGSQRLITDAIERQARTIDGRERGGFWIQALNNTTDQGRRQGIAGYDMNASGVAFGLDSQLNDQFSLGVAYSYLNSNVKSENSNKIDSDGHAFSLYGRYQPSALFVDGSLTYARHDNDSKRYIAGTQAKGHYDSELLGVNLLAGYHFDLQQGFWVEPQIGLRYSRVELDSFSEKGSSAALRVDSQRYETGELGAGFRFGGQFEAGQGVLIPEVRLMGWHDVIGDRIAASSRFMLGGSPFTTRGVRQSRDTLEASLGLDYRLGAFSMGAHYLYTTRSSFDSNSLQAHLRYAF